MLAYYESTGIVLHPFDWEDTELEKDLNGRYVVTTNVTVGADQQLWRNPVVTTPAMTQGQWLAGAFGLGAKLYDREQANIAISTETRDLFERNAICIRAEERVALEVGRPEAFVKGTFR
jgi:HK97 family phage major capsid protein